MTDRYETVVFENDGVLIEPTDTEILVDTVIDSTFHSAWDLQALGERLAAAGLELT